MREKLSKENSGALQEFLSSETALCKLQHLSLLRRVELVMNGISKRELEAVKALLDFDYDSLSEFLMMTNRALHTKKGNDRFSSIVSDRIMMVLELYSYGCSIIGGLKNFQEWMKAPNERMENQSPLSVIKVHSGLLAVREAVANIRNGHP